MESEGNKLDKSERVDLYFEKGSIIASTSIAAAYFDVTASTLSNWMKAGCPRYKYGYWDIRAVTEWRAVQEGRKLADAAEKSPDKLPPAQQKLYYEALLKQQQLENAQLRNRSASGEYLSISKMVDDLSKYFVILKHSVTGLAHELGQMVAPYLDVDGARRIDQILSERARDALEQLSITGVYTAKEADESQ